MCRKFTCFFFFVFLIIIILLLILLHDKCVAQQKTASFWSVCVHVRPCEFSHCRRLYCVTQLLPCVCINCCLPVCLPACQWVAHHILFHALCTSCGYLRTLLGRFVMEKRRPFLWAKEEEKTAEPLVVCVCVSIVNKNAFTTSRLENKNKKRSERKNWKIVHVEGNWTIASRSGHVVCMSSRSAALLLLSTATDYCCCCCRRSPPPPPPSFRRFWLPDALIYLTTSNSRYFCLPSLPDHEVDVREGFSSSSFAAAAAVARLHIFCRSLVQFSSVAAAALFSI